MKIQILTDSASCLPVDVAKKYNIDIIPITIIEGEKTYKDCVDIDCDTIYKNMREGVIYKTSQIAVQEYYEFFEKYAKANTPVCYISMSTGLSSTYNSSLMAVQRIKQDYKDYEIYALSSILCALAQGVGVVEIVKNLDKLDSISELENYLRDIERTIVSVGFVDNLEYLAKGGRIPKSIAFLGSVVSIKPFIYATDKGKLEVIEKLRGKKKALQKFCDIVGERYKGDNIEDIQIFLSPSDNIDDALTIKELIKEKYGLKEDNFIFAQNGATIGSHTGPGSLFMFFLSKEIKL